MEHYIYHTVYVNKNIAKRTADTVQFPPDINKMPGISNQQAETNSALYLIEAITYPEPTAPFESIGARKLQSIRKLAFIVKQKLPPQEASPKETVKTGV